MNLDHVETQETDAFEAAQHPSCRFPDALKQMKSLERRLFAVREALTMLMDHEPHFYDNGAERASWDYAREVLEGTKADEQ